MKRSMIGDHALINQSKPGSGNEPTNIQRRTLIGGALARAAGIGTISGVNLGSIAIAGLGSVLLLLVLEAIERR